MIRRHHARRCVELTQAIIPRVETSQRDHLTSHDSGAKTPDLTHEETEELRAFLREHVSSFEELEALLLFVRAPQRAWESFDVASALGLSEDMTETALSGIAGTFVARESGGGSAVVYRYAPRAELEPVVELLRRAYAEERLTVVQIMSANAMQRVRSSAARRLAEAFRLERSRK